MTVVSEGPLCLKIHLNKFELKKYFYSYDKIIFTDPQVKKTIEYLFTAAVSGTEFETDGKRIIEIFPTASGGCILKFTTDPLPPAGEPLNTQSKSIRLKRRYKELSNYVFAFADFESLLSALKMLLKNEITAEYNSNVYHTMQRYYLNIHIPIFDRKTAILLNEFCDFSARGEIAVGLLDEHARCIAKDNAIQKIGSVF